MHKEYTNRIYLIADSRHVIHHYEVLKEWINCGWVLIGKETDAFGQVTYILKTTLPIVRKPFNTALYV